MTPAQIAAIVSTKPKGGFFTVIMDAPVALRKDAPAGTFFRRVTSLQMQRCPYSSKAAVKAAVEAGVRAAPVAPSWKEYFTIDGVLFARHLGKGTEYLSYPLEGNKSETTFFDAAGNEVDKETIRPFALAEGPFKNTPSATKAELAPAGQTPFADITCDNIREVH